MNNVAPNPARFSLAIAFLLLSGCYVPDRMFYGKDFADQNRANSAMYSGNCTKAIEIYTNIYENGTDPKWRKAAATNIVMIYAGGGLGHADLATGNIPLSCPYMRNPELAREWGPRAGMAPATVDQWLDGHIFDGASAGVQRAEAAPDVWSPNSVASYADTVSNRQLDQGLSHCVRVVRDSSGGSLENLCSVPVKVVFNSDDFAGGETEISAGGNSFLSAMGFGAHGTVYYVACPKDDHIFAADGVSYWHRGKFMCVRP